MSDSIGSEESRRVSLVFVATNERSCIIEALDSLFRDPPRRPTDVVVIDNASSDGTCEAIAGRWPEVRLIRQPRRRGLSANLNAGIHATGSAYVMVCNSDIVFRPAAVDRLAEFLDEHPRTGMVAPGLRSPEGELWPTARRWYTPSALVLLRMPFLARPERFEVVRDHLYTDRVGCLPHSVDWVLCAATMLRRDALDDIGLFDERFRLYFDDVDLALRMHEGGWDVWLVPDATVVHHWRRASRRPLSPAWFSHLTSLIRFLAKHRRLSPRPPIGAELGPVATEADDRTQDSDAR